MSDWMDEIADQLDKDEPQWFIRWATGSELESAVLYATTPGSRERLRTAVAKRIFHRLINSAISAGIVREIPKK